MKRTKGEVEAIASRFVDVALSREMWGDAIEQASPNEMEVFATLLSAAGFEGATVVYGKLMDEPWDADGHPSGEPILINRTCPYKVICKRKNHLQATIWLDGLLFSVFQAKEKDREALVLMVIGEIEESIPLEPIKLTREGNFLREFSVPPARRHTRDEHDLPAADRVGGHEYCGGWMERHRSTKDEDVLVCCKCYLRVYFPAETKTFGELRWNLDRRLSDIPLRCE